MHHEFHGEITSSTGGLNGYLFAGSWQTDFVTENHPLPQFGQPKSFFSHDRIVVKGSDDEATLIAERDARLRQEAAAERERKEKGRAKVLAYVSSDKTFSGGARGRNTWPAEISFSGFDEGSGRVVGQAHWTTLDTIVKWEGTLVESTLSVVGTEHIRAGRAMLGCTYTMTPTAEGKLSGSYRCPDGQTGKVWINPG